MVSCREVGGAEGPARAQQAINIGGPDVCCHVGCIIHVAAEVRVIAKLDETNGGPADVGSFQIRATEKA